MPKQLTRSEKIELWKRSLPSFYIISIIILGSVMLWSYYGLEVTFFQFLAQFSNAVPLPIQGTMSANLEAATGSAYAIGGLLATWASFRIHPEHMIYLNFILMNI
ncbi:Sodium-dependent glucose transporter-like protein, partial [Euroglyphus maynei]